MVVVGADVHKATHTFVAVDAVGKQVGQVTVPAVTEGHRKALAWARERFGDELVWAIEDCRHMSARLERDLLASGQKVVRVPPKMMAEQRRVARTRGKSDPIDALAVARAYLREPSLPVASHDEASRELKLLVDRRETLVAQRTATINSLLWRVHELDPAHAPKARSLDLAKHQQALRAWLVTLEGVVAELALEAGIPRGVLNVVHGFGGEAVAGPLTSDPRVDRITFTGSSATGVKILQAAAANHTPVSAEMGGKSANIVFADADFEKAVAGSVAAWMFNHGQCCVAGTRLFVERPIFDRFVPHKTIVYATGYIRQGLPRPKKIPAPV